MGPTGAGKTAFSIALAERLGAEIVNADSRQLYRGMDLGTAKPDAADRARAPHHLIDVCDPERPIDVAEFAALARAAVAAIAARGRPVLVVGGSGLYLRVLRGGIFAGPPAAPAYRAELGALAAEHGAAYLHDRLCAADAAAARRISVNDLPRVIRALEVFAASGIPISEHQRRHRRAGGGYENLAIGLTVARARLYEQIDRRFDSMIAAGLVEEVRGLLDRAGLADRVECAASWTAPSLPTESGRCADCRPVRIAPSMVERYAIAWWGVRAPSMRCGGRSAIASWPAISRERSICPRRSRGPSARAGAWPSAR